MGDDKLDQLINSYDAQNGSGQNGQVGPSQPAKKEITMAEFQQVLDSTPLFMKETPAESEDNYVLEALRSLIFEGEGDEVAQNFKNHGNELYAQKSYKDAIKAYTDGLDAKPKDLELKIALMNNRVASNLALKNYGMVLKDASVIIAFSTQARKEVPTKALFRTAQALVALDRYTEARDVIQRGKAGDGSMAWANLEEKVERGLQRSVGRMERARREGLQNRALADAISSRGIIAIRTPGAPENPHPPHFDPTYVSGLSIEDPGWEPLPITTPLIYPAFLLYPQYEQSDLITHFSEASSFSDQLGAMFPASPNSRAGAGWADWDRRKQYHLSNLVVYLETKNRRMLKCDKSLPLVEVLASAVKLDERGKIEDGMILRDGMLSFVILPDGVDHGEWLDKFKWGPAGAH